MTTSDFAASLGRPEAWIALAAVGGFLALFWFLRGTPPGLAAGGDEGPEAPASGYRDRVVAGVTIGLLLIALGCWVAATRGVLWSLPVLAAGFALVLTLIARNERHRHASPALRRTVAISRAALNMTLVGGLLVVANVVAFRYGGHDVDLTRDYTYSLASLSRNQVESLDVPVVFHLVHGRSALARRQMDRLSQLLDLYRSSRPDLIRVESLDRFSELSRGDDLASRTPELALMQGGGVLIEYGTGEEARFRAISNQEMFRRSGNPRASGRYESAFRGEDAVTAALIGLREGKRSKVAFTAGHGESGSLAGGGDRSSVDLWKSRLAATGCEVLSINLLTEAVPDDVELLIVAGPSESFKPQEVDRLKAYTDRGTPVLACLGGRKSAGLETFLKRFNLELGPGIVVDPKLNLNGRADHAFCLLEPSLRHPLTNGMAAEQVVLMLDAAPIRFVGTKGASDPNPESVDRRMLPSPVLRSSPNSWVESDPSNQERQAFDAGKDVAGPAVVVAAVAERPDQDARPEASATLKPRLVLVASRSAGDDVVHASEPTNLDLLMNAASWLRDRQDSVGVPPKTYAALTLTADPGLRWRLILVPTVVASAAIAGLGALVYYVRRD